MARADVAAEHEGGGAVRPTLEDIRAARFLTDRVQIQPLDQIEHMILIRRVADANLQPVGLAPRRSSRRRRRIIADDF
jgi:hypothetical protein